MTYFATYRTHQESLNFNQLLINSIQDFVRFCDKIFNSEVGKVNLLLIKDASLEGNNRTTPKDPVLDSAEENSRFFCSVG